MSLINREKAIRFITGYKEGGLTKGIVKRMLMQLPEENPDELVDFIKWVLDYIWDEDSWEYNWQGFPELVCRRLLKLGFITTDEEGNYERNE